MQDPLLALEARTSSPSPREPHRRTTATGSSSSSATVVSTADPALAGAARALPSFQHRHSAKNARSGIDAIERDHGQDG